MSGAEAARFTFPRQPDGERLCLADYVRGDVEDWVALFAVTCGEGVRERAQAWKERGDYLRSHVLQALAIECAEGFAEIDQVLASPPRGDDFMEAKLTGKTVSLPFDKYWVSERDAPAAPCPDSAVMDAHVAVVVSTVVDRGEAARDSHHFKSI